MDADEEERASDGGRIVRGRDEGGERHFLHGHPITCGRQLEYLFEDEDGSCIWEPCRFELERFPLTVVAIYDTARLRLELTNGYPDADGLALARRQCTEKSCDGSSPHFLANDKQRFRWTAGSRPARELAVGRRPYDESGLKDPASEVRRLREALEALLATCADGAENGFAPEAFAIAMDGAREALSS